MDSPERSATGEFPGSAYDSTPCTVPSDDTSERVLLAVSDLHLEEETPQGWRRRLRHGIIPDYLHEYADRFGADELWIGGDVGDETDDIRAILDYDFDRTKIAIGDGDGGWYREVRDSPVLQDELSDAGCEYADVISSTVAGERPYLVQMAHFPDEFDIDWDTEPGDEMGSEEHQLDQPRVIMYGHAHVPRTDVIRNAVVIGLGSTFANYDNRPDTPWDDVPERSMYAVSLQEDAVDTYHIDLEKNTLFDHQRFELGEDGFEDATDTVRYGESLPAKQGSPGTGKY